jgi:tudor domain-containing protein 3
MRLTDGKQTCTAVEFKPTAQISEDIPPGTKLCLTNVTVKLGVLLLEPKVVQVSGLAATS